MQGDVMLSTGMMILSGIDKVSHLNLWVDEKMDSYFNYFRQDNRIDLIFLGFRMKP
jgi:hypothetical protein